MVDYQNGVHITITTGEGVPLVHDVMMDDEPTTEELFLCILVHVRGACAVEGVSRHSAFWKIIMVKIKEV